MKATYAQIYELKVCAS